MKDCQHVTVNIEYFENEKGVIEVGFCAKCGKHIRTRCEHLRNEWVYTRNEANPEEQALICRLCGAEGT